MAGIRFLNVVPLLRIALSGALLCLAVVPEASAQRTSSWLPGHEFGLASKGNAIHTPSAQACRDACLHDDKCRAWEFINDLKAWAYDLPGGLHMPLDDPAVQAVRHKCNMSAELPRAGSLSPKKGVIAGLITGTAPASPSSAVPPPAQQAVAAPPVAAPTPPAPTAPVVAAVASPQALPAAAGRRVALVIGQSAYQFAPQLPNPANDASDIAAALRKLNFEVVFRKDVDRRGFDDAIREFGKRLDNADLALFFYAGHGLQVGGKNYLVPVDAKLERAGDLALDAVDVGTVLAQMEQEKRVNLVFLDACRDNPLARSLARSLGTRSTAVGQGLASIQSAVGTMIVYSTQPDNVALDGDGRNSPFTTALLKHLADPGIDVGVVMRRVRADVVAATHERQVPWDHSSLIGDVVLAP